MSVNPLDRITEETAHARAVLDLLGIVEAAPALGTLQDLAGMLAASLERIEQLSEEAQSLQGPKA